MYKYCHQTKNVYEVEEILTNVYLRLSMKSLLICKSVCRYWRSLICNPSFMRLHLIQCQENSSYIVCYRWGGIQCEEYRSYIVYLSNDKIHLLIKIDGKTTQIFPSCIRFYFEGMICSFNGLVCCINHDHRPKHKHCTTYFT